MTFARDWLCFEMWILVKIEGKVRVFLIQEKVSQVTSGCQGVEWEIKGEKDVKMKYRMNNGHCDDGELSMARNTELNEYKLSMVRLKLE